jgi:hypothetical protein
MKQALSYLQFVPPNASTAPGVYLLYEDWAFSNCLSVLYLIEPGADIDDTAVGRFWPAKLLKELRKQKLNWGILTDGAKWRLYSTKSSRPYEDFVELSLAEVLEKNDEGEYGLFERFFHKDSFVPEEFRADNKEKERDKVLLFYKCRLDRDKEDSEKLLDEYVKKPLLYQIDEILQYLCNGFIADTTRRGDEYTEEERREIFESSVKLLYRCLFLFYSEARRLLPSEAGKAENYSKRSIRALCREAHKFQWGKRKDYESYDLWKHLKGLTNAVNDGDTDYGIMGYNGGLFDDEQEKFLGRHRLRNDSLSRALYLLAYVEPHNYNPEEEDEIPYEDLEVRHLGELYENILEYTVLLADADRIRRRTRKGVEVLLTSETTKQKGETLIKKGDVYFGETALERKQTGSYYTPEPLVRFLNTKAVVDPLRERFEKEYRERFNEFLDQASSGQDEGSRQGAARAAIAIVERFVNDVVLDFKVCDLAMGSGHFLVDAANQMAGLIVELLAEIPNIKGLSTKVTSNPNDWRRLITRNCLYGVDLNPLAVDLAKLSLWLNCFAIDHKLTFLDHHLRCGNSLIGIRSLNDLEIWPYAAKAKNGDKQLELQLPSNFSKAARDAAKQVAKIAEMDEDSTEDQRKAFGDAHTLALQTLDPLADLYTGTLMSGSIKPDDYYDLYKGFSDGKQTLKYKDLLFEIRTLKERHHFLHFPLEFPEVFAPGRKGGFDATVGNPPWDVLEPDSQEFYLRYFPEFRKLSKQEAVKKIAEIHKKHPEIEKRWNEFEQTFYQTSAYCKRLEAYDFLTKGKIDLYKAFIERFFQILTRGGHMGIVCPSGFYTDESLYPLRNFFFKNAQIKSLYCFENRWPVVFSAVDSRFKFILLSLGKDCGSSPFKCSFMQHDPERLPLIEANSIHLSVESIARFSPHNLSIMEFNSQRDFDVTQAIYGSHPHLGDRIEGTWNIQLSQEFNTSSDSHLFNESGNGAPLYEGKVIAAFDHQFSPISYWIDHEVVQADEWRGRWRKLKKKKKKPAKFDYQFYRAGFRRIAASTNERAFLSTIIPVYSVCPDTTLVVRRLVPDAESGYPVEWIDSCQSLWLVALFNSAVLDFVIRKKITTHLDMHFVYTLPVPRLGAGSGDDNRFFKPIVARAARLISTTAEYGELWVEIFSEDWKNPNYWYPKTSILDYGPAHEREIRAHLKKSAKELTREWNHNCGVHERLADRRDTGDRAQLRAEIDAYVAHLYGLSRDDFAYILEKFPVLRRKEEGAFGEYMSKRKCLEEYDRIANIL